MSGIDNLIAKSHPYWITIKDLSLTKLILETFSDKDKNNILNTVIDEPRIISEILEILKMPQTSGYRKVKSLIDNGLLITQGHINTRGGKKVNKYRSVFGNVRINIKKNKIIVQVQIIKELLDNSSVIQLICSLGDSKIVS
jgi:predicted DNA-binding ArsR family transcriptional regulator